MAPTGPPPMTEAEYWQDYEIIKNDVHAAMVTCYTHRTINQIAATDMGILEKMNRQPEFWMATSFSLQSSLFIVLARLLDSDPGPDALKREEDVWGEISYAFSEPVTASDDKADYAATQILAESFRKMGYDGIRYKSRLGKGNSIALFDLESAKLVTCGVFQTRQVAFDFSLAGNPYYLQAE